MSAGKAVQTTASRLKGVVQGLQQGYSAVTVGVPIAYKKAEGVVSKHFNAALKNNAQYVVKDQEAADKLLQQWFWTRMSRCRLVHPVSWGSKLRALAQHCGCPAALRHMHGAAWVLSLAQRRKRDVLLRA